MKRFVVVFLFSSMIFVSGLREKSCSHQISKSLSPDKCQIHNLAGCPVGVWHRPDHSGWKNFPLEASFTSYRALRNNHILSAVNVSVKVKDDRVSGFAIRYLKFCEAAVPICRFYHFASVDVAAVRSARFVVGEVFFRPNYTNSSCRAEIVALSSDNQTLGFRQVVFRVPDRDRVGVSDVGKWQSLVVVDEISSVSDSVVASFSTFPDSVAMSYVVQLVDVDVVNCRVVTPVASSSSVAVDVTMSCLQPGVAYVVRVSVASGGCSCSSFSATSNCSFAMSPRFFCSGGTDDEIPGVVLDTHAVLLLLSVAFLVTLVLVTSFWLVRHRPDRKTFERVTVFVVYSHDCAEHVAVVEAFANFLIECCHCHVVLDKWDVRNKEPWSWIDDCIAGADYVVTVWSQGAYHKSCKDNTRVLKDEPAYLGVDLFSLAQFKIGAAISVELQKPARFRNLDKFCHVALPYVPRKMVAPKLSCLPTFAVPSEVNALLCHLHRVRSSCPFAACASWWLPRLRMSEMVGVSTSGRRFLDAVRYFRGSLDEEEKEEEGSVATVVVSELEDEDTEEEPEVGRAPPEVDRDANAFVATLPIYDPSTQPRRNQNLPAEVVANAHLCPPRRCEPEVRFDQLILSAILPPDNKV